MCSSLISGHSPADVLTGYSDGHSGAALTALVIFQVVKPNSYLAYFILSPFVNMLFSGATKKLLTSFSK
jgi:ascorbate-specific PTS system EIIC-type component UlaA